MLIEPKATKLTSKKAPLLYLPLKLPTTLPTSRTTPIFIKYLQYKKENKESVIESHNNLQCFWSIREIACHVGYNSFS